VVFSLDFVGGMGIYRIWYPSF